MRILIYGAGVIGSLYAVLFAETGYDTYAVAVTFESSFGDKFMYQHARKAPDEMRELHKQFYAYMKKLKEARYEIL